jgi:predicted CXXCH cytochrome family protein
MRILAVLVALMAFAMPAGGQRGGQESGFPHRRHDRLFPLCESCHAGIMAGDTASAMPDESVCRECHNGTDRRAVTWRGPQRGAGLLRFTHPSHAAEVNASGRACATCHATAGSTRRMDVGRARPETCQGCHTHQATAHLAEDNRCAVCHVPLTAATRLSAQRVAALPRPASHERDGFTLAHEPASQLASASCSVCHARESCARCHVNASSQPLIAALGRDARVASLVAGLAPIYPVPPDHGSDAFETAHGVAARANVARCATCHARPSCTTCHVGSGAGEVLARIPLAQPGDAAGVRLTLAPRSLPLRPPPGLPIAQGDINPSTAPHVVQVHAGGFRTAHGAQAAAGRLTCEGCHEQRFCSDCHAGENRRVFHPANFAQRHAADSYGRETECASCHNAELFCRSCHAQSGLTTRGRLDVAFHNAQPLWLLQHGRAARQGLQGCTTCHVQRDCLTCHSTIGWGVNPHGPGFQADRLASRNATQCLMCHIRIPGRN